MQYFLKDHREISTKTLFMSKDAICQNYRVSKLVEFWISPVFGV
jgi:hypothetical protein